MKKCPYCNEDIQDIAKKCRHCGEWFEEVENKKEDDIKESQPIQQNSQQKYSQKGGISNKYIFNQILRLNITWILLCIFMIGISTLGFQSIKNIYNGPISISISDTISNFKDILVSYNGETIDTGFTTII